jgi:hypothetical protein
MDLLGKKFGRLTVVGEAQRKGYVTCRCECGTQLEVRATSLTKTKQPTRSCGCLQREVVREIGSRDIAENSKARIATDVRYNTNFGVIERTEPHKNNRSGVKGIWFDKNRELWEAYIGVHGKRIHLGRFKNRDDAVKARALAEEEYFRPLIEEKNKDK